MLGTEFLVHHRIESAVKRVEFISDRMSHIVLRGCWCNIIVWNVHAPSEEKCDDSKRDEKGVLVTDSHSIWLVQE